MKKLMTAVGAAGFLTASSLAAVGAEATGIITDLEWSLGTVTLDRAETYSIPQWVRPDLPPLYRGDRVTVIFDRYTSGLPRVTEIRLASDA